MAYHFYSQSVSVRLCVRASHACVRKSRCEGGAKLHGFVRANVRACRVFWVRHMRAITLEIFQQNHEKETQNKRFSMAKRNFDLHLN